MKRSINILSLLFLLCAGLLFFYVSRGAETVNANAAFRSFPANQPQLIKFDLSSEALEGKSKREKLDQLRDWLLYTVVSDSGQSAMKLGEILYDLPATRNGYMHHVGNFEYGDTRSRLVREGEVVALVPADNVPQRIDQLAHIADEHRKNTGVKPKSILVFEYKLNIDDNQDISSGEITRRDTIDGEELFTSKYGYYESKIDSLDGLKQFMQQTDDIVFGQQASGSLILGGRKIQSRISGRIGVEDVAAIWQSEHAGSYQGSGFSLDPTYQFDEIKKFFDKDLSWLDKLNSSSDEAFPGVPDLLEGFRPRVLTNTAPSASAVSTALGNCDIEPFFRWLQHLRETSPELINLMESAGNKGSGASTVVSIEEMIASDFGRQKARYDGDLRGTQVGMILFYTDLMAKLWDFDYKGSTPREIEDFKSELVIRSTKVSPLFKKQIEETPWARLWFGPDSRGYEAVGNDSLVFARKATKLFAKSKGSSLSTNEVEPDPPTAMFINWWDDHFEEVARYEPQYERLNEIMKWSLLISWLNKNGSGDQLAFLSDRKMVKRDHRFPEWAKQQPDLRFNKWSDDMFVPADGKCVDTETMPLLESSRFAPLGDTNPNWTLTGGVSLAEKSLFVERTALSAESRVATLARRSGLNYSPAKSAGNAVETIEGSAYRLKELAANRASFTSIPKPEAALRTNMGDLASGEFHHVLTSESRALNVVAKYGQTDIGNLSISNTGNGFKIGWQSRQLDVTQSIAQKMSSSTTPEQVIARNPMVESAVKLRGEEEYLLKTVGSENWTHLKIDGNPAATLETGWSARFGDVVPNSKSLNIKFLDQTQVSAEIGNGQYIVMNAGKASSNGRLLMTSKTPTSGGERITIFTGEQRIDAFVDRGSESLFVKYDDLPEYFQKNPSQLQEAISSMNLKQIPGDGILRVPKGPVLADNSLGSGFLKGDYGELTRRLTGSPAEFKSALEQNLSEALKQSDDLLGQGNYRLLKNQLDELIEVYGPRPELTIRRGIGQIQDGQLTAAARNFNESISNQAGSGRDLFFNEVNLRLRNSTPANSALVQFASDGKTFSANCEIKTLANTSRVQPEHIDFDSGIFYVENNPQLNNIDWNTNLQASLKEVIAGEFGEVIKLPRGDLSKFRPTRIYSEDVGKTFESVRHTTTEYNFRFSIPAGMNSKCQDGREDSNDCRDRDTNIYIVRLRSRN